MAKPIIPPVHNPRAPKPGNESEIWPIVPSQQDLMHDPKGRELLDPLPKEPPVSRRDQTDPIGKRLREILANERFQAELRASGIETFEEANDFDVGDDEDYYHSPYEERLLNGFDNPQGDDTSAGAAAPTGAAAPNTPPAAPASGSPPQNETPPVVSSPAVPRSS